MKGETKCTNVEGVEALDPADVVRAEGIGVTADDVRRLAKELKENYRPPTGYFEERRVGNRRNRYNKKPSPCPQRRRVEDRRHPLGSKLRDERRVGNRRSGLYSDRRSMDFPDPPHRRRGGIPRRIYGKDRRAREYITNVFDDVGLPQPIKHDRVGTTPIKDDSPPRDPTTAIPLELSCFWCRKPHVDRDEWATRLHKVHLCEYCGGKWQPLDVYTVGIKWHPSRVRLTYQTYTPRSDFRKRKLNQEVIECRWPHTPCSMKLEALRFGATPEERSVWGKRVSPENLEQSVWGKRVSPENLEQSVWIPHAMLDDDYFANLPPRIPTERRAARWLRRWWNGSLVEAFITSKWW